MPVASRVYRALLAIAPRRLRTKHGAGMQAVFADALAGARARGRFAVTVVWACAVADLVIVRAREPFRTRLPQAIPTERKPIMLGTDLKYALRWLLRQKVSTALVTATLALGIAANLVVFSLVNGLFLRPFPFPDQERLVYINATAPKWNLEVVGVNYPDFIQWRQHAKLFEALGIWEDASFNLSEGTTPERIEGAQVTYDFPLALGITPVLGRMFTAQEDVPNGPPVVVIGEGLWAERFNRSPDVLGRMLKLNGTPHTIVGVMPRSAEFPARIRLWVPLAGDPAQSHLSYGSEGVIGRMRPGVTAADAERELLRVQQSIWDARDKERIVSPFARPLRQEFSRRFRAQAGTLLAATSILMIVACANVASVMLARALARRREMGIRLAVGASRVRLAKQLFVENTLLAIAGGTGGLILSRWALQLLLTTAADQVPAWASFALDWRTVAFAFLLTGVTTLLFGSAPALHASRGGLRDAMQATGAGATASPGGRRTLAVLVGAEFAMAASLLICGGLLLRAYARVQNVDPGFHVDRVLTFRVSLPPAVYGEPGGPRVRTFWDRLTERVSTLTGVEHAGLVSCPPLGCHQGNFFEFEGRPPLPPGQADPVTLTRRATPSYFAAIGSRLKYGRFFSDADGRSESPVAIVNETFAKTFWPGVTDPVGRRFRRPTGRTNAPWMTVVGVVEDMKHYGLERPMRPGIYEPLRQRPTDWMTVVIRTKGDPTSVIADARGAVRALDPELAVFQVRTMEQALRLSMADRRTYSWLLAVFAGMALVLALAGSYGVTTYLVSQRTREIGIRVALGARAADVMRTVLRGSLIVAAVGIAFGAAVAVLLARNLREFLFGVASHDPAVISITLAALLLLATMANVLPARRAANVDPMRTLRSE